MAPLWLHRLFPCIFGDASTQITRNQHSAYPDFDLNATHTNNKQQAALNSQTSFPKDYNIVIPVEPKRTRRADVAANPLPSYIFRDLPWSAQRILAVFEAGLNLSGEHGVVDAFNSLRQRRFKVWIDNSHRLKPVTKFGIRQTILQLLLLAQATGCDMEFLFMSQSNTQSKNLSEASRVKAETLEELWVTTNWEDAKELVARSSVLTKMGLQMWIEKNSTASKQQGNQQTTADGPSAPQKSDNRVITQETDAERHLRLLNHVRDLKAEFWQGYDQTELDMMKLTRLHKAAIKQASQQPKSLNSVSFTYHRETGVYKRMMERKEDAMPTTVLILTGSPLQPTESHAIQEFQKDNDVKAPKTCGKGTKEVIEGEGTQFCISTLALDQYMDKASIRCYADVDDHFKGGEDINDLILVNDSRLVQYGLSEKSWLKLLNAHNQAIDDMKFKKDEKYGREPLIVDGKASSTMPSLADVKMLFGQGDEEDDEDEEDEEGGSN
ncbi:hypothetical protein BKA56DRAFT_589746 [Ilyonectria sp. MPI-CAGE-AT-0026]|nr:hypothetical protein BKA56DRAFT_589746 [Ilyonectria sp. MPI-CAGE-AT-0026]